MVKTYLTLRQTYSTPDTSVTRIQLEENFTGTVTTNANEIGDMDLDEWEDEDFS